MKLEKLVIIPLAFTLLACEPKKTDIILPNFESIQAVNCEVRAYNKDIKRKYDVVFTTWYQPPIKDVPEGKEKHVEPDWEHWYSRRDSRREAQIDCMGFYNEAEKVWKKYQKELKRK